MKLEIGKLYETTDGVRRCTRANRIDHPGCFDLDGFTFRENGDPVYPDAHNVRVLYKLRVNEHMESTPGQKFQEAVKRARFSMADVTREDIEDALAYLEGPKRKAFEGATHHEVRVLGGNNFLFCLEHFGKFDCPHCTLAKTAAPKPFRLSGPGWYKYTHGWVKLTAAEAASPQRDLTQYIAKATEQQAAILEGV